MKAGPHPHLVVYLEKEPISLQEKYGKGIDRLLPHDQMHVIQYNVKVLKRLQLPKIIKLLNKDSQQNRPYILYV